MPRLPRTRMSLLSFRLFHSVSRGCSSDPVPLIVFLENSFLLEEGGADGKSLANRSGQ
jgi:hypothetical protein